MAFKEIPREGQGDPQRPPKVDPNNLDDTSISIPGVDGQGQIDISSPSRIRANPEQPIPPEPQAEFLERVQIPETEPEPPDQEQVQQEPQQAQEQPKEAPDYAHVNRDNFLKVMGYKSYADAAKTLKEQHATITKKFQDKSEREKQLEQDLKDKEEMLSQMTAFQYQQPPAYQQPAGQGQDDDVDIFEDPKAIDRKVEKVAARIVQETLQNSKLQQDVEEVRVEDPTTWNILVKGGFMTEAFSRKPYLNRMGIKGLRQAKTDAIQLMRSYSQTVDNIVRGGASSPQQPMQAPVQQESQEQTRLRLLQEEEQAKAAHLPQGGTARGIQRDRNAEKAQAIKNNDPFKLAEILLEGIG